MKYRKQLVALLGLIIYKMSNIFNFFLGGEFAKDHPHHDHHHHHPHHRHYANAFQLTISFHHLKITSVTMSIQILDTQSVNGTLTPVQKDPVTGEVRTTYKDPVTGADTPFAVAPGSMVYSSSDETLFTVEPDPSDQLKVKIKGVAAAVGVGKLNYSGNADVTGATVVTIIGSDDIGVNAPPPPPVDTVATGFAITYDEPVLI